MLLSLRIVNVHIFLKLAIFLSGMKVPDHRLRGFICLALAFPSPCDTRPVSKSLVCTVVQQYEANAFSNIHS